MDRNEELRQAAARLIEGLHGHLRKHRELVDLLERKKDALVAIDLEGVETIETTEREVVTAIGELEAERIERTAEIGRLIGHPRPAALRLREIVPYVESDQADELIELRDALRAVADRLERLNALARTLASHSMDHIHIFLAMVSGVDPTAKDYSPKGTAATGIPRPLLDRRI